jgi:Leucine-rich repeat (LRR) protein
MPVGELGQMTVTEISLAGNNLQGIIPSILYHLPELKKLDVRDNDVSITFNAIHQAENLEELYLDQTRVSKLDGIGKASSLKILHLHKNSFGWQSIPEELFDLTNLQELELSDSMFSGTLSTKVGNMVSLKSFSLIGNELTGQIPSEIGMLQNLKDLELSNNSWFGTLPASVTGLVSLEALFLDNDKIDLAGISGPLRSFTSMPKLRELHLSKNSFTGTIPNDFLADVDDSDSLINIHLDGNQLLGSVPAQLSAFSKLNIYLQDNLLTAIGDGLCEQSQWLDGSVGRYKCDAILCPAGEYSPIGRQSTESNACELCPEAEDSPYIGVSFCLSIQKKNEKEILGKLFQATNGENWKNKEGWMDDAFDICQWYGISCREGSTVESVLLGSNRLTGTPPTELFELPNLKFLWLYSNPIDFSFEGIGQASSLRSLLLDSTKLRSLEGIGSARSLVDVDVRFNNLAGTIPKELDNLVNLQSFTCSQNDFSGPVPELTALRKLNTLRMSNNQLTGTLPTFASHPELKSLDLSENNLIGTIPSNFMESVNEQQTIFLDLSENRLTGNVPGELSRFAELTLYLRENRIEGIDPGLCSMDGWNEGDVGSFQCDGILCPTGTYSPTGRASRTGATCELCSQNTYFGSTTCGSSGATARFGAMGLLTVSGLTIVLGLLFF